MIAKFAVVAIGAGAIEPVNSLVNQVRPAGATVLTGIALTSSQLYRTILASVFGFARTKIIGSAVGANSMFAWIVSLAFVDFVLAVIALVALVAFAGVAADAVYAVTCLTGTAIALVYVYLAILAGDTLHAQTLVPAVILTNEISRYTEEYTKIYT